MIISLVIVSIFFPVKVHCLLVGIMRPPNIVSRVYKYDGDAYQHFNYHHLDNEFELLGFLFQIITIHFNDSLCKKYYYQVLFSAVSMNIIFILGHHVRRHSGKIYYQLNIIIIDKKINHLNIRLLMLMMM